jgi:hypothetical protein
VTRIAFCALVSTLAAAVAVADPPKPPVPAPPKAVPKHEMTKAEAARAHALAKVLRELLVKNLPDPLSKSSQNWGQQKAATVVYRRREGLRVWTEPVQEFRNDGVWRRYETRIADPEKIVLAVTELSHPEEGKALVTVGVIAERVEVKFEQQVWRNGVRLYGGETRAHCKGSLLIKAEVVSKTEFKKGAFFPDVTLTVKATEAHLGYEDVVVDHTAGLDGEAANALGDFAIRIVKAVKPDLEGDLLAKANAAIVKAAGTRELRVALDSLLRKK